MFVMNPKTIDSDTKVRVHGLRYAWVQDFGIESKWKRLKSCTMNFEILNPQTLNPES